MRKGPVVIVLIVMSVFILAGIALTGYMLLNLDSRDIINVEIGESGETAIDFSELTLNPGDSKEFTLSVGSELPGDCTMTIEFFENGDGVLKDYVYVVLEANGEELCDCSLTELFNREEPIELPCVMSKTEKFDVKVKYYMPLEVDNAAENADCDFVINLTVSNE